MCARNKPHHHHTNTVRAHAHMAVGVCVYCGFYNNAMVKLACIRIGVRARSHFGYAANCSRTALAAECMAIYTCASARAPVACECACLCLYTALYAACVRACLPAAVVAAAAAAAHKGYQQLARDRGGTHTDTPAPGPCVSECDSVYVSVYGRFTSKCYNGTGVPASQPATIEVWLEGAGARLFVGWHPAQTELCAPVCGVSSSRMRRRHFVCAPTMHSECRWIFAELPAHHGGHTRHTEQFACRHKLPAPPSASCLIAAGARTATCVCVCCVAWRPAGRPACGLRVVQTESA